MDENVSFENFPHGSRQSGNQEFQKVMLRGRGGKAPLGNHMWGQRSRVRYIHSSLRIFCTRKKATSINHTTRSPLVSFCECPQQLIFANIASPINLINICVKFLFSYSECLHEQHCFFVFFSKLSKTIFLPSYDSCRL